MWVIWRPYTRMYFCGTESNEGITRVKWRPSMSKAWKFDSEDEAKAFRTEHHFHEGTSVTKLEEE